MDVPIGKDTLLPMVGRSGCALLGHGPCPSRGQSRPFGGVRARQSKNCEQICAVWKKPKQVRSRSRVNVVQSRAFSDRLEEAIARYHTNAITTAEVLQELIGLAKDISVAHQRGEEEGLTQEEIAFYDALAQNESAVEVLGDDRLRVIAHELLNSLRSNASVDWQHRESTRARMRVLVKRILRKYGYPPDLQDAAVRTVLQQAEVLAGKWAA